MKRFQLIITRLAPYLAVFAVILATMVYGSRSGQKEVFSPIVANFKDSTLTVTSDQVSETYTVADIANSISLPSAATISENYITVNGLYESTGSVSSGENTTIEKPTILNPGSQRGILAYTVKDGDTIPSIIANNKIKSNSDQIRWSNGLKDEKLTPGNVIYISINPGIVYTVKSGDDPAKLASKYESNADLIISANDLEGKELAAGMRIILPNGVLPKEERPEYVRPRPVYTPSYRYVVDSGDRRGMFEVYNYGYWSNMYYNTRSQNNPGAFGNCTWFAWYWRRNNMPPEYWLPTGPIGNARDWPRTLGGSYYMGSTPQYGAVFQSSSGPFGHVGVVIGVEPGVQITVQEMNHAGPNGMFNHVYQSTMSWSDALRYNYIYQHR